MFRIERERIEQAREKTEEEVVEHFDRWAANPLVRDWIAGAWVNPEERQRRLREILDLPPLPPPDSDPAGPSSCLVIILPSL